MSAACRVLPDGPGSGAWNMALDEALAESTAADGIAWLRFYSWSPATLSLGYFQRYEDRQGHAASCDCPFVRRASGGGAILHDAELTYSLTLRVPDRQVGESPKLYLAVHEALVQALANFGIAATVRPSAVAAANEPFLCFQRRALGDVLVRDVKIAGSAQRRRRGALLQHGSVLLGSSTLAPELPGLRELTGAAPPAAELADRWLGELRRALNFEMQAAETLPTITARAKQLEQEKYAAESWNRRR